MSDLRTALTDAFGSAEEVLPGDASNADSSPTISSPAEVDPPAPEQTAAERARDDAGRFVSQQAAPVPAAPAVTAPEPVAPVAEPAPIARPSTWKKEYWPLYDKLAQGQALTAEEARKLADYTNERENQFKSGVSTYKAEADKAREINEALAPFMPELQRYNIPPGQWIANLGRAHQTLAQGSPEQKLAMFKQLATEYGVPLDAVGAQGDLPANPQVNWLGSQLQQLQQKITGFETAQQRTEQERMQADIARVQNERGQDGRPLRPHFEAVREQMAGLLQSGMAQTLEDAYAKAVRLDDALWEQQRLPAASTHQQAQQAVARAKAAAVSPRSASPGAQGDQKPKGLRDIISAQLEAASGGGRV